MAHSDKAIFQDQKALVISEGAFVKIKITIRISGKATNIVGVVKAVGAVTSILSTKTRLVNTVAVNLVDSRDCNLPKDLIGLLHRLSSESNSIDEWPKLTQTLSSNSKSLEQITRKKRSYTIGKKKGLVTLFKIWKKLLGWEVTIQNAILNWMRKHQKNQLF